MIKYICETCNLDMDTETCSNCGRKTSSSSEIYWCKNCNVPSFFSKCNVCGTLGKYIGTDLRPVFPEEQLLLGIILDPKDPLKLQKSSVWSSKSSYIIDGQKERVSSSKLNKLPLQEILELRKVYDENLDKIDYLYFTEVKNKFVEVNKTRFEEVNEEAVRYIGKFSEKYSLEEMFVSFSGGKDSTVVSHLVTKALGTNSVLHIFGDTTLEFDKTHDYKKRFRTNEESKGIPMITAKNREKSFDDLCKVIGPPSRVMRWCCITFKTGAISRTITSAFKDKTNILTFYGIRKSESVSRSKYDRETESPKIAKQTVVSPIFSWLDYDVWLYILTEGIDFNEAYRLGYTRVGCWCCPNNGSWSEFLSKVYMYDKHIKWRNILVDFANKIGKPDAEEYVDSGNWKARQGGNGLDIAQKSIVSFEPCVAEDDSFSYDLQRPIEDELYELFKPFGYINKDLGNKRLGEVYILGVSGKVSLILKGRKGSNTLKVTIKNKNIGKAKSLKAAESRVQCQLTKYQMCMDCRACEGVCKFNAISVKEASDGKIDYSIDDAKCTRCGDCIGHFESGCYMKKVLRIKKG